MKINYYTKRDINEGMKVVIMEMEDYRKWRIDHERSDKGKISTLILGFAIPVFLGNLLQLHIQSC